MPTGAYTKEFSPVGRSGDLLEVDTGSSKTYYQIEQFRPVPDVSIESTTVDPGDVESGIALDNLAVWEGWLGQYRIPRLTDQLPDDVSLQFDHGGAKDPVYQNLNQRGEITNNSPINNDMDSLNHLFEWFILGDTVPTMTVTNNSEDEITLDLNFAGFVFNLESVSSTAGSDTPVYVPVEAIRGQ